MFWIGLGLAVASRRVYLSKARKGSRSDEGRRHGGRRGHGLRPLTSNQPEADGADRRQAVHGAHPRAAQASTASSRSSSRSRSCRRRSAVTSAPARSSGWRIEYSVEETPLGTAGSVRLGERPAGRHVPRHLGRRAEGLRPGRDRRLPPREGSRGPRSALKAVAEPARVRDRGHRRGRPHRAFPREAVLGPGVLGHDQHRASTCSSRSSCATSRTDRPFDFSKELFPLLLEMGRPMYGYVCEGYWQDIGNLDRDRQANMDALDERVAARVTGIPPARERLGRGGRGESRSRAGSRDRPTSATTAGSRPRPRSARTRCSASSVPLRESAHDGARSSTRRRTSGGAQCVEGAVLGRSCDVRANARRPRRGRARRRSRRVAGAS